MPEWTTLAHWNIRVKTSVEKKGLDFSIEDAKQSGALDKGCIAGATLDGIRQDDLRTAFRLSYSSTLFVLY